uniref:condensation domain-containing protein n=1 Tax=Gynuella sp. TaxID=2969146 RepID=UPI003D13F983
MSNTTVQKKRSINDLSPQELLKLYEKAKEKGITRKKTINTESILKTERSPSGDDLSYAQQRIWFLSQLDSEASSAYSISESLRVTGELNLEALTSALNQILCRHEVLRVYFVSTESGPKQRVNHELSSFPLDITDLSTAATKTIAPFNPNFDLRRAPLIGGQLIKLEEREYILNIAMHHIISDAWSMSVFTDELNQLYEAFIHGKSNPLTPLAVQYIDFAIWQRKNVSENILKEQRNFWWQCLNDAPKTLNLPTDYPRPEIQDFHGNTLEFELPQKTSAALKQLGYEQGTTLFNVLLTGWAILLSRLSCQQQVVIGTSVSNRNRTELEPLIGMFVNTLALKIDIKPDSTIRELLKHVHSVTLSSQANQDIPFEQVVEALDPPRSLSYSPIFQVMFDWINTPETDLDMSALVIESAESEHNTSQFDISLAMWESEQQIYARIEYATALFDPSTIEHMAQYLMRVIAVISQNIDAKLSHIELLSPQERHTQLSSFSGPARTYPGAPTLHQRFEAIAERLPTHCAVVHNDQQMDYQTLDRRSNQVAQTLLSQGVQRGQLVAIHCPRSIEFLIGILGTL